MNFILLALVFAGLIPLCMAWWAKRRTSLSHALTWTLLAWLNWGFVVFAADGNELSPGRYLSLCLTGCAGIAVLGARRPHVGAWDFVVLVLLLVMLLPLAESRFLGTSQTEGLRMLFFAGTIAVGALNYAPTRIWPAALLVLGACTPQLLFAVDSTTQFVLDVLLLASPWLGWFCWRMRPRATGAFDQTWRDFRDSWGFVWSQRVREQFNAAAGHAGWMVRLHWGGSSEKLAAEDDEKCLATLRAILQRFVAADQYL